jgi:hypothetical protein
MKKSKPVAKVNDVFLHQEEQKMFIVVEAEKFPKGKLYTLKEVSAKGDISYKRYYEEKLKETCVKTKNAKVVKVLFGKNK